MTNKLSLCKTILLHYRHIFNFSGSENRRSFVVWFFYNLGILLAFAAYFYFLIPAFTQEDVYSAYDQGQLSSGANALISYSILVLVAVVVVNFFAYMSASIRRLHDLGQSGVVYWLFLVVMTLLVVSEFFSAVGFLGIIACVVYLNFRIALAILPTKKENNQFVSKDPFVAE
ncbi:hypothetical protein CKF54_01800 [Psittacicella hinzii]|uniref:DUF805 domain-containing protein n=1 Tax=Psittacicella hinzii TaxID=2028575 RepID=A0A3A1Y9L5_9GAMM|nr:DUF805 domain-containing protein [Psittacicella hinzii]RIY34016.1 hypothetical protein CKF54_01800 [Psittacicella hinzii]